MRAHLSFDFAVPAGRLPLVFCLVAFILTFFVTRLIVRYIRAHQGSDKPRRWWQPRNLGTGSGLHIHHVVIGVILVMISGVTMVTLAVDGGVPEFTAAAILFGIGAALVLDGLRARCPHLELVWADAGYLARQVTNAVAAVAGLRIEIVKRSQPKGWELLPRRWVIERTFAWFGRNRRLARDYEGIVDAAIAFIHLATIQLVLRRLARP